MRRLSLILVAMVLAGCASTQKAGPSFVTADISASMAAPSVAGEAPSEVTASATPTPPTTPAKPTPTAAPTPTPAPTFATFGDGTWVVGKDIQPGTYRLREAPDGCYYERVSGFGGTLSEIIDNGNTDAPWVVTIAKTDKGFTSKRCGTWSSDLSAITDSKTSFGAGLYIVGTDMIPGTYKSSGQEGCYWARLKGFGGSIGEIIANANTDHAAIVTIGAKDRGFESVRCGTWTKQ